MSLQETQFERFQGKALEVTKMSPQKDNGVLNKKRHRNLATLYLYGRRAKRVKRTLEDMLSS